MEARAQAALGHAALRTFGDGSSSTGHRLRTFGDGSYARVLIGSTGHRPRSAPQPQAPQRYHRPETSRRHRPWPQAPQRCHRPQAPRLHRLHGPRASQRPQPQAPQRYHRPASADVQGSDRGPAGETAVDRSLDTGVGPKASAKKSEVSLPQTGPFFAGMRKAAEQQGAQCSLAQCSSTVSVPECPD